ncbi:MAG: family 43 glycosylhydrolase [Chloroflexi bacterium]|nr:family 43 glycosylhydrolase [Chloroflexota bacterium]
MFRRYFVALLLGVIGLLPVAPAHAIECVFKNPLLPQGQDPSVVYHDGYYYLVQSNAGHLTIAKSDTLTDLGDAEPVTVFTPPPGQPYSYDMWAPELFYHEGEWYIYVAATEAPGNNPTHRMYVLQADSDDPQGTWTVKGKVYDPTTDKWAIDGVVFEYNDQLYMVWSGWPGDRGDFPQNLYIAPMSDPLTLSGERVLLSEPDQPWERSVAAIQEGPQAFIQDDQLSIVYSADASWSTAYKLGLLKLTGENPLDADAWQKVGPVFSGYTNASGSVYGVGHNSNPVPSPDGSESWLVYHTKTVPADGWGDRAIVAQEFSWNPDDVPDFGQPLPLTAAQEIPSGEPCGLIGETETVLAVEAQDIADGVLELTNEFVDTGENWVDTLSSYSVSAWVKLSDTDAPAAIVSQDGGLTSNFVLEYTGETFAVTLFDAFGKAPVHAAGTLQPEAGQWYHLVLVRDVGTGEFALYVNGERQAEGVFTEDWDARGSTIVGAARQSAKRVNLLSGEMKALQIYNGALTDAEISRLYNEGA